MQFVEGVEKISKVLGPLHPTPLSPPLLGGETTSWGFLSRKTAQKAPEKGIFTPFPSWEGGRGG